MAERGKDWATDQLFLSVYLLALFFTGLGYLAVLPAFEGFDETAHYSITQRYERQKRLLQGIERTLRLGSERLTWADVADRDCYVRVKRTGGTEVRRFPRCFFLSKERTEVNPRQVLALHLESGRKPYRMVLGCFFRGFRQRWLDYYGRRVLPLRCCSQPNERSYLSWYRIECTRCQGLVNSSEPTTNPALNGEKPA